MDIYNKNLKALFNKYHDYEEFFKNDNMIIEKYTLFHTKEGNKSLKLNKDNLDIFLHSKYYPCAEAHEWLSKKDNDNFSVHIFYGLGLGYYLLSYLPNIKSGHRVIVYEPDIHILKLALQNFDFTLAIENKNIDFFVGEQKAFISYLERELDIFATLGVVLNLMPNYERLYSAEISELRRELEDVVISKIVNHNTVNFFAKQWQFNLLKNIPYIFESKNLIDFKDKFLNKPVIIVSAGPSLNKNVKLLKELKDNALVICVGRALKVLLKEGITPDIVATVDGALLSSKQFEGVEYSNIPLIYIAKAYPKIISEHKGVKIVVPQGDGYLLNLFKRMGIDTSDIDCGGSVANMAFSFAKHIGGDPIVFVGQDLAFTNGQTHAKGTLYGGKNDIVIKSADEYKKVRGIDGSELLIDTNFYLFLIWFQEQISNDKSGRMYINATEGGADIKGTKVMKLSKVIEKYCAKEKLNKDILKSNKEVNYEHINIFIESLNGLKSGINEIIFICNKAIKYSEDLYLKYKHNNTGVSNLLKKLNEVDDKLKSKTDEFEFLFSIVEPIMEEVKVLKIPVEYKSEKEKSLYATQVGINMYKKIIDAVKDTNPLIDELLVELRNKYSVKG